MEFTLHWALDWFNTLQSLIAKCCPMFYRCYPGPLLSKSILTSIKVIQYLFIKVIITMYDLINCYHLQTAPNTSFLADSQKVVLVFFIGGCTFAEISALRFLSALEDCKSSSNAFAHNFCIWLIVIQCHYMILATIEYVIATTNITNGNSFLKSLLIPEINKNLKEQDI